MAPVMTAPALAAPGPSAGDRATAWAARTQRAARAGRAHATAGSDAFLRVYAQILFSRSPAVGMLVLAATATVPRAFVAGASAVLVATLTALLLDFDREAIKSGDYGYNALLVGLGVAQTFGAGAPAVGLLVLAAAASVLVTAALRAWLGGAVALPVLSLPFLIAFQLALGAASFAGAAPGAPGVDPSPFAASLPAGLVLFVRSLGGLFFLPRLDAGALVLAALLMHSRIAASLAATAFAAVLLLRGAALPAGVTLEALGYNAVLTATALGGVFFVPSTSSFLLALLGATLSILATVGLAGPFARLGVPLLIFPFNATVLLTLFAFRQRARDLRPKSVDFISGTPEENLAYYRTRRSRFQWLYPVAFTLPVRGVWSCTQAIDGAFTHQGSWRHAFDLEVRDADGHLAREGGTLVEHFHCWRLPVLAAADGTVIAVESGVADNAVGAIDVERNWGNHVLVQHAAGLYSLVAHLSRGSVKVVPGQLVRRGEVLGLCGSSGRSPRPHLHFHLQGTAALGAPTLPCRFTDVVALRGGVASVETALEPREGDAVRNLEPGDDVAGYLTLETGKRWSYRVGKAVERFTSEVDLLGRLLLGSREPAATLFYGRTDAFFTAYDVVGARGSVLHLLRAALSRVPFEGNEALVWTDHLPARPFRPWLSRILFDLLSPFLPRDGVEMEFRMRREGARLVVEGASKRKDRRGAPVVRTRAELSRGAGPTRVEVVVRGKARSAERIDVVDGSIEQGDMS
jgi:urea transporter/murein DD-endopeptidase MepM/ murein hydrolase activator NlpD